MPLPDRYPRGVRSVWLGALAVALVGAAACASVTPPTSSSAHSSTAPTSLPRAHDFSNASIKLTAINAVPLAITMATRAGDNHLYLGTQSGQVYAIDASNPDVTARIKVLDIGSSGDNLVQFGGEQGLLGMTFSADGLTLYVHYTAPDLTHQQPNGGTTTVAEYAAAAPPTTPVLGMFTNPRIVLTHVRSVAGNHNGGSPLIGPDGYLYLALGDGGNGNDQGTGHLPGTGNAQALTVLDGKLLRIQPNSAGGHNPNPSTNPFLSGPAGALPEIWSYGLRNPFRISFDRMNGDLWIGDVGQSAREEIDHVATNDPKYPRGSGANFGWNLLEGFLAGPNATRASRSQTVRPVFDYDHSNGNCAIIGGYVYRGTAIPDLYGAYVYSDYCHGSVRGLLAMPKGVTNRDLGATVSKLSSFGEDGSGELYMMSLTDGLFRIDQAP